MNDDSRWIEDVRRWCQARARSEALASAGEPTDLMALGYEAADPTLLARQWPDAPASNFDDAR